MSVALAALFQLDGGESFYRQGQSHFSASSLSSSSSAASGRAAREKCDMFLGSINPPAVPSCPPPTQHSSNTTSSHHSTGTTAPQHSSPNQVCVNENGSSCSMSGIVEVWVLTRGIKFLSFYKD